MQSLAHVFDRFESEGTVFGSISKKDFNAIPQVVPPEAVLGAFETICSPIDSRVELAERENATLTSLRDSLLPALLSGDLAVTPRKSDGG